MTGTETRLLVNRTRITESRISERRLAPLGDGEVRARVDSFALTANNISYALSGDMLGYWQFFPEDADWGVVPVWGFAEVIESRCAEVAVGARFYGYLPMASHVVMKPVQANDRGFTDGASHRAALPALYNLYARTEQDPAELAAAADLRSLLFPLFSTSYLIADYLQDNALFGAEQVIIGSASSKTGFATAHYAGILDHRPRTIIGLTSPGNIAFTEKLGLYDRVLSYDSVTAIARVPSVYIDMSGDGAVLAAVHHHLGDDLKASIGVGATHWDAPRNREPLPGAAPAFFFAPAHVAKRDEEWGQGEVLRRANAANLAFATRIGDLLDMTRHRGADAVAAQYAAMVSNATPPTQGVILSFGELA